MPQLAQGPDLRISARLLAEGIVGKVERAGRQSRPRDTLTRQPGAEPLGAKVMPS